MLEEIKLAINLQNYQKENTNTLKKKSHIAKDSKKKEARETEKNEEVKANVSIISSNFKCYVSFVLSLSSFVSKDNFQMGFDSFWK